MATLSPETQQRLTQFMGSDKFNKLSPETQQRLEGFLSKNLSSNVPQEDTKEIQSNVATTEIPELLRVLNRARNTATFGISSKIDKFRIRNYLKGKVPDDRLDEAVEKGNEMLLGEPRGDIASVADTIAQIFAFTKGGPGLALAGAGSLLGKGFDKYRAYRVNKKAAVVEKGVKDIVEKQSKHGKAIESYYSGPKGETILPESKEVIDIVKNLPNNIRKEVIQNNFPNYKLEGNSILKLRDVQNIRNTLRTKIKETAYRDPSRNELVVAKQKLKDLINKNADPQLRQLDKNYTRFKDISGESLKALQKNTTDARNLPTLSKFQDLIKTNDPNVLSRLEALKGEVPSMRNVIDLAKRKNFTDRLSKLGGYGINEGLRYAILYALLQSNKNNR